VQEPRVVSQFSRHFLWGKKSERSRPFHVKQKKSLKARRNEKDTASGEVRRILSAAPPAVIISPLGKKKGEGGRTSALVTE